MDFLNDRPKEACRAGEDPSEDEMLSAMKSRHSDTVPLQVGDGGTHLGPQVILQGPLIR